MAAIKYWKITLPKKKENVKSIQETEGDNYIPPGSFCSLKGSQEINFPGLPSGKIRSVLVKYLLVNFRGDRIERFYVWIWIARKVDE